MGMCSALGMYAPEVQASNGGANSLIATSVQQTKKVTGNISDSMDPLIGATIKEKGTSNGVVTDLEGNFSINLLAELKKRLKISIFLWRKSCASR